MLYVLDTDSLSLLERQHAAIVRAVETHRAEELAITVISVEEQLSGWYTMVRRARTASALARAYERLTTCIQQLAGLPILSFTEPAIVRYTVLRSLHLNIKRMDLRIAAIALENTATLVTRNLRDFGRVPDLQVENWAD